MGNAWRDASWKSFGSSLLPPIHLDKLDDSPRKRSFLELDSVREFEVPGLRPRADRSDAYIEKHRGKR